MKVRAFIKENKYILSISFLLICISLFMMLLFLKESDYFWHIKAGEYMFKNNTILTKDVFSWFMNGKYWMSHEWAFEYLIYLLKCLFGNAHLFIYPFCCILSLLFILFFTNKKSYLKNIVFSLFWILGVLMFGAYMQARPHLLSFSFLALTIYFTYDLFQNKNSKKIYFLPLVTLFWTNFHGGSSNLSYLFCILFGIVGMFKFDFLKIEAKRITKKQIIKYFVVSLLCILAICINPHGIRMLWYPYANIMDTVMIKFISEWQPTTLSNSSHYVYFVFIVFMLMKFLFSDKKIQFIDLVLYGVSVILGLKSIRFWGYTYIIMSYVIFNYISNRSIGKGACKMLITIGLFFLIIFLVNCSKLDNIYTRSVLSDEMIEFIKKESPKRLYNLYDYGGELVYNGIDVFIDGRADLYSKYNLVDYISISKLEREYVAIIDNYDFDYFLVVENCPINTYLSYNNNYEKVFFDNNAILYKKKASY